MPFETLNGVYDAPPFHVHCRSIVVPWMSGMINDQREAANAELQNRPKSERDTRNFKGMPGPEGQASAPRGPNGPDVGGGWAPRNRAGSDRTVAPAFSGRVGDEAGGIVRDATWTGGERDDAQFTETAETVSHYVVDDGMQHNAALRAGTATDSDEAWATRMDRGFSHGTPTDEEIVLYRGTGDADRLYGRLSPGNVIVDPGFVSTSVDVEYAKRFVRGADSALVEIRVPPGARVLDVNTMVGSYANLSDIEMRAANGDDFWVDVLGTLMDQTETLLPRGVGYRFLGWSDGHVVLEMVLDG